MKILKKITAILSAIVLMTGLFSGITVYAETPAEGNQAKIGTTEYATLDDAFAAAKDGDTIELLCDIDTTGHGEVYDTESIYYVNKNVTLDFAEFAISDSNTDTYEGLFYIDKTGALTLVDAQVTTTTSEKVSNDHRSLVRWCLGNLTIESTKGSGITCDYVVKYIGDASVVTINGGTYNLFRFCEGAADDTSLYVNGGSFTSTDYMFCGFCGTAVIDMGEGSATSDKGIFIIEGDSTRDFNVKSGTFKADGSVLTVLSAGGRTTTINGGEFITTTENSEQSTISNRGTLTINGGTFTANTHKDSAVVKASYRSDSSSLLYINGGTITNEGQGAALLVESNQRLNSYAQARINGGTINSKGDGISIQAGGYAEIKGGTVTADNRAIAIVGTSSTAIISGGEFETSAKGSENSSALYLNRGDTSLSGGTFTNSAGGRAIVYMNTTDDVYIVPNYHALPADWDATDASRVKIIPNEITVHFESEGEPYATVQGEYNTITFPLVPEHSQGRAFLYWADTVGNVIDDLSVLDNDTTLYAVFETYMFTVAFEMNGHGTQITAQEVAEGDKAAKPADPTESGWTFKGWYTDPTLQTAFDFNTAIIADTTLYANWTANSAPDPLLPETGINTNMLLWVLLLAASGAAMTGTAVYGRKRKKIS